MLEADFQRYYHLDLREEVEHAGVRRLVALVTALPGDAAVNRDGKRWTTRDEIAAVTFERAELWGSLAARPHYKDPDKLPPPLAFSHPDRETETAPKKRAPRNSRELNRALGL